MISLKSILLKIKQSVQNNKSEKYFYGEDFNYLNAENNFIQYEDKEGSLLLPQPNILGEHQLGNISTSIMTARNLFNIKDEDIKNAIVNIKIKAIVVVAATRPSLVKSILTQTSLRFTESNHK